VNLKEFNDIMSPQLCFVQRIIGAVKRKRILLLKGTLLFPCFAPEKGWAIWRSPDTGSNM